MLMFVTTEDWPVTIDQTECCRCHQCHLVTSSVFALCLTRGHCGKLYFGVNHNTVNHNTEVLWFAKYTEVYMKYHCLNDLISGERPFSFVYFWQKSFHKLFYGEINNWRIVECPWLGAVRQSINTKAWNILLLIKIYGRTQLILTSSTWSKNLGQ